MLGQVSLADSSKSLFGAYGCDLGWALNCDVDFSLSGNYFETIQQGVLK